MEPNYEAIVGGVSAGYSVFAIVIAVLTVVAMWKLFEKAGKPGWAAIVPFYNMYCMYDIALGSGWLFLLTFIPCVNFVITIIMLFKLAEAFGKGAGYGFGLLFLNTIFVLILGFGSAEYVGVDGKNA